MKSISVLAAPAHYVLADTVGSEPYVSYKILEYLSKLYDVNFTAIVGYSTIHNPLPSNIKVYELYTGQPKFSDWRKLKFYVDVYKISAKIIKKLNVDIVHHILPFGYEQTFNFLALFDNIGKKPFIIGPVQNPQIFVGKDEYVGEKFTSKRPLILSEKIWIIKMLSKPILKKLFSKTINRADKIVAVNNFTKALYSKYVDEEKITVIPLGIDLAEFDKININSHIITKDKLEIMYAGMLTKRKGVEYLIRAFQIVSEHFPNSILRICGKGPQMNYLKNLCKKLNIQKRVIFEGFVPREKLIEFYKRADIFVLPSLSESFGIVLLEAMASGTPCIASDIIGPNEIVEHGKTGFLFPPKNVNKLAQYLTILLEDERLRKSMGRESRKKVEEKYDWKVIAGQYYKVYKEVIGL